MPDVALCWFVEERAAPTDRPYSELTEGCGDERRYSDRRYLEEAIDEMFSQVEAEAFVAWLKQHRGQTDETTKITEAELPIAFNTIGAGAVPYGGGIDCLVLRGLPASLGFRACGYYDLRHYEPVEQLHHEI
jgi:hypothetical protein